MDVGGACSSGPHLTVFEVSHGRVVPAGDQLHVTRTARSFSAEALGYVTAPVPIGFDWWDDWHRSVGVTEDELGIGADRIQAHHGEGPLIWFQVVPEKKSVENRIHIDAPQAVDALTPVGPGASRSRLRQRGSSPSVLPGCARSTTRVLSTTSVALLDPEVNEFDIN